VSWIGCEAVAQVGGILVGNPFGLGFGALIILAGIVELAIEAGVEKIVTSDL